MKQTPLYEKHCALGGKMIDFGGWLMPVQYSGILDEHEHVRNAAGLFDVSHMGEIKVEGEGAASYLQKLVTNDLSGAAPGRAIYSPMCYPSGGVVDDLLIYKLSEKSYLVVVNAANTDKDFSWFEQQLSDNVKIKNVSERYAQLAIQGPNAQKILQTLTDVSLDEIKFYRFQSGVPVCGIQSIVSRTGYTGEDGFEIYLPSEKAASLWDALLTAGGELGLVPAGLGARDTLRFEAALPLYGHELSEEISPLEAGLGRFVRFGKNDFIGREALIRQHETGPRRKLVGFEMTGRGIARHGFIVMAQGIRIGSVTTGNYSPTLKKNLGLALIDSDFSGENFEIVIREKAVEAAVISLPFYTKKYKK
ncbi:aminomethyltransferase (glycine cleavage system protein T) [Ruminococcaceae bacterium BL-6]|nr:aminomethyltransferase (glycine cleavage system protein T) [Ruminococcaceae bacterium BL-6]